ncbi:MAG: mechanosensitive ion channel family protein [Gemmatimonadales bacterium]|nr:MAG: mechanosensitive ion channel family protein [Gemmatimonadales bacterium]
MRERFAEVFAESDLLQWEFLGNSLLSWVVALGIMILAYPTLRFSLSVVVNRLEKFSAGTPGRVDEILAQLLGKTKPFLVFLGALWLASLALGEPWSGRTALLVKLAFLVQAGLWAADAIHWILERYRLHQLDDDPGAATAIGAMGFLVRVAVWAVILLSVLSLLDFEIGPALAGLGVGGIAIALAVQNILGDLFASLSIIFDRPFVIGDFIIVGSEMGTVEHVGLKTTRVRALSGEQLIFSNSDLLSSRVRNFKRMDERRILFHFGVQYDTGYDRLKKIPQVVSEVVEEAPNCRFDRAHFSEFGDSSLDFEVVYFMTVPDFTSFRDTQQAINLGLYRRMEEMGVSFAFPTRTLHLNVDGATVEALAPTRPE